MLIVSLSLDGEPGQIPSCFVAGFPFCFQLVPPSGSHTLAVALEVLGAMGNCQKWSSLKDSKRHRGPALKGISVPNHN